MDEGIGIIGYGRFGRLTARYLSTDFDIKVWNRNPVSVEPGYPRIQVASLNEVCRQHVVIPAVPISAFLDTLQEIAPLVNPDATVIDVCSVKTYPVQWMEALLPDSVSILATHPMFGPDSAADTIAGKKIALCRTRIGDSKYEKIKSYLEESGLQIIETTPEQHDREIAVSLSLTHFIGRSLASFGAEPLQIDTEGYKRLLHILGVVEHDTWQLFCDMNQFNPYADDVREKFILTMQAIDAELKREKGS